MPEDLYGASGSSLAAAGLTDIYTCPANKTVKLTLFICNRSAVADKLRLAIAPNGAADSPDQYMIYDYGIEGNLWLQIDNVSFSSGDVLRARALNGTISIIPSVQEIRTLAP